MIPLDYLVLDLRRGNDIFLITLLLLRLSIFARATQVFGAITRNSINIILSRQGTRLGFYF